MRTVLLDVDGTLIDSTEVHQRIWRSWSDHHGLVFDMVWAASHGRRPVETFADVAPHLDPQAEYDRLRALLAAHEDGFHPIPGARDVLGLLPVGCWGLVTSAPLGSVLRRFQASRLPTPKVVVDGDSVTEGKPSPEGYLRAAALLGASPSDCLVVEDAPAGIAAGRAAGMRVLAVASTHPPHMLTNAHECFPTLNDAQARITGWATGSGNGRPGDGAADTHASTPGQTFIE